MAKVVCDMACLTYISKSTKFMLKLLVLWGLGGCPSSQARADLERGL